MSRLSAVVVLTLALGANAFAPARLPARTPVAVKSAEEAVTETAEAPVEGTVAEAVEDVVKPAKVFPTKSVAVPVWPRPVGLNSVELAGDFGFDPLGLGKDAATILNYREMEVKHARLAMLAAAGWPLAELYDSPLAKLTGAQSPIDLNNGLSPSTLNGGLGLVSPFYWGAVLAFTAAIEVLGGKIKSDSKGDYLPGDFSFDPLGLYPKETEGQLEMQVAELKHGRIAMVAIVAFVAQEFASKVPVVKEWPFFFEPIWTFLFRDLGTFDMSRGYIEY